MSKIALALGMLLLAPSVFAANSYLCVADLAAGFSFDKTTGAWRSITLVPSSKYIVSKSTLLKEVFAWEVKEVGKKYPFIFCKEDFGENGILDCERLYEFRMNINNGRFLLIYPVGYWTDDKNAKEGESFREGDDSPHMEIGKCSPL